LVATGASTFPAGSAGAPSITTSGDTNTGIFFPAADTIAFTEGGVEAMRITSAGDVGIGTSSPSKKLHVTTSSGDAVILVKGTSGSGAGLFQADGDGAGSFPGLQTFQSGTHYWSVQQRGDTNLHLNRESGSGRVIIGAGPLQVSTTVSVGGATPSSSGAGITFPASQNASSDANTLDDYEEGTWTPVASAASGSLTAYSSNGTYTKIGRIVTLFGSITTTTVGTASGTLNFTGVPFNTLGGEQYNGVSREVITTGANHFANISNASGLLQSITGGGITWVSGYTYKFTVTYQV
jgi:hypothetical protein